MFFVLDRAQLNDLAVDEFLTFVLLLDEAFLFALLFHQVSGGFLLGEGFDAFFLKQLLLPSLLRITHLLLISLLQVFLLMNQTLFSRQFLILLLFEVILCLSLN